jgi:hypothetical protein
MPVFKAFPVIADTISAQLLDGRTTSVPLAWSWRLSEATPEQRSRFEIIGSGSGIRWPHMWVARDGVFDGCDSTPNTSQARLAQLTEQNI